LVLLAGLITSALLPIGFHEDRLVEPSPPQSTGRKFLLFLLKKDLLRWIGFDGSNDLCLKLFLIRWIGYYSLTKVFKGKPFISKPISSLLT
jgi:hypothetical protein